MAKLLLLDGNSIAYRAYYAFPEDMANQAGEITNAVYGFAQMLTTLIRDQKPDGLVVCFDRREPTFRHEQQPAYKAQREGMPPVLVRQMDLIRQLLAAMSIPAVDLAGYEADDLLATLAVAAQDNGDKAIIVSGDRDTFQLPNDPLIQVLYTLRGVSEYLLLDEAGVLDKVGVHPSKYVQYAAMRGDKSDNLPGVPGVGEKTAAKLLDEHGDLDGIFDHLDDLTPKLRQNLSENEEIARQNLTLMKLRTDAPIDTDAVDIKALRWQQFDQAALQELFAELEFKGMYHRLVTAAEDTPLEELVGEPGDEPEAETITELQVNVVLPDSTDEAVKLLSSAVAGASNSASACAVAYKTAGSTSALVALAVVQDAASGSVLCLSADLLGKKTVANAVRKLFEGKLSAPATTKQATSKQTTSSGINVHDAKPLMAALANSEPAIELTAINTAINTDTQLALYLLNPAVADKELTELLESFCSMSLPSPDEPEQGTLDLAADIASLDTAAFEQLAAEALAVHHLAPVLEKSLQTQGMAQLYTDIERPLIHVLQEMEARGVGVDGEEISAFVKDLSKEGAALTKKIFSTAGHKFNINSPKELGTVLFTELGLTTGKKTQKGSFSTDATTLEAIRSEHAIVDLVLQYREVTKLQSTCQKSLLDEISPDGRIHATFHQTASRTGRMSSENPNLHAIPVRGQHGLRVRRAFVPHTGFKLLVADYDQIELRVVAHLSQDPALVEMFATAQDVHSATAAAVFDVKQDKVTSDMRNKAKMVSYGLIYGMNAFGLGQRLGIETGEAGKILDAYFAEFQGVKNFMTEIVEQTRERGYTETMFGRRRSLPELNSKVVRVKRAAERQAMNAPVQGLAADIFKIALLRLAEALTANKAASYLVLQVHDEVVLEVAPDEKDDVAELTESTMKEAVELSVPLEVNVGIGANWADSKT